MKFFCICILLVFSISVNAQKKPQLPIIDFSELNIKTVKKDSVKPVTIVVKDTVITQDIKAQYWDHTVYNPDMT